MTTKKPLRKGSFVWQKPLSRFGRNSPGSSRGNKKKKNKEKNKRNKEKNKRNKENWLSLCLSRSWRRRFGASCWRLSLTDIPSSFSFLCLSALSLSDSLPFAILSQFASHFLPSLDVSGPLPFLIYILLHIVKKENTVNPAITDFKVPTNFICH